MKKWLYSVCAVCVFAVSAFAQDASQSSNTLTNFRAPTHAKTTFDFRRSANQSLSKSAWANPIAQHPWYWEAQPAGSTPAPPQAPTLLGWRSGPSGFAPATLRWSLTGKHKAIPVIDLTITEFKPGEKADRGAEASQQTSDNLWMKTTHSISKLLR